VLIALLCAASAAQAIPSNTRTWTGAAPDHNWSTGGNWDTGAPLPGDSLVFPASPTNLTSTNDFSAGTQFRSITIAGTGYQFSGNPIKLSGGISATYASNGQTFPLSIELTGAQSFSVAGVGTLECNGALSGSAALTKSGSGILHLYHDNSGLSGTVTIAAGAVDINDGHALGTGSVTVQSGSVRFQTGMTVANAITLNGYGYSGGGAIQALSGTSVCSGVITLGSDASIGVIGTSLELSSIADSSYTLTKNWPSPMIISGTPAFTGAFNVSGGALQVDGTLPSTCDITVGSSATLDGTGTTGPVTVQSGGALAPGHSPGALTTAGVSLSSGATFSEEINGTTAGTQYDQVVSSGPVSLGNATLSVSLGYTPTIGDHYTIINTTGPEAVTGNFNGLAEGDFLTVGGRAFSITYAGGDGNDVVLTRAHVPTTFSISAGNDQSASLATAFATALKVRLLDEDSDPLAGASVTFTAPGSGASGTFASSPTVTTDADGYATAPAFTANTTLGSYHVTASSAKVADLSFSLTNAPGPASSLTIEAGNDQSAQVGSAFATRLKVLVKDAYDNAVPSASVTFTAPGSGAGGTFSGSSTVTSDGSGFAEAPVFTANGTSGSYAVTASCAGVASPASFTLANTGQAPAITSAAGAGFTEGSAGSFTVTTTGSPKATLTETGALPGGVTFVDDGDGTATISGTPADGTAGDYAVTIAATNGIGSGATQAFVLHVESRTPPVTTVRGVPSRWVRRSVKLTFTAKSGPGGAPVDYTEYRLGSGRWVRGDSVTVGRQGVTKVAYRSVSTAGDVEATQVCTVRIDLANPVVTDYGHPMCSQGGAARFAYRVTDAGASLVRAKLVITRYGHHVRTIDLGRQETGKQLVALVRCGLPVGTWNWRIVVHNAAGGRGAGHPRTLEVHSR
jgi:autotransporter-associated beta strand protein